MNACPDLCIAGEGSFTCKPFHKCWSGVNFENVELHNFTSYCTLCLNLVHICNHENC